MTDVIRASSQLEVKESDELAKAVAAELSEDDSEDSEDDSAEV